MLNNILSESHVRLAQQHLPISFFFHLSLYRTKQSLLNITLAYTDLLKRVLWYLR